MLAKVVPPTNDFHALARYLVHGKSGTTPHPNRVAWVFGHNLPSAEPEHAAKVMTATAQLSARTKNAAYHLMITWGERERPSPEAMQKIARQTLLLAGLGEHQALVMGHGDKPHRHLHMLINRVHPTTGKAWKTSHDFARFDAIMRELADAYGFEFVPSHAYNPDLTADLRKGPTSPAKRAAMRGADTARPQLSRNEAARLGAELSDDFDQASTWDDIAEALAARKLTLEAKGRGHIAGAGAGSPYVKFSALGLTAAAKGNLLKSRATPRPSRPLLTVDGIDIVRAFITLGLLDRDDLRSAIADAQSQRLARKSLVSQFIGDHPYTNATTMLNLPQHGRSHHHTKQSQRIASRILKNCNR